MGQYIPKSALVAEIEKKLADILACKKDASTPEERIALTNMLRLCKGFLSFIDTLEVKEVGSEKEVKEKKLDTLEVLEDAAYQYGSIFERHYDLASMAFIHGARWQQQKTDKDMTEALRTEYELGRHNVIEKTLKWLWDLNQEHEIMSYTDSHVLSSEELQQYYKNNIEE